MKFTQTDIADVMIVEPRIFADDRGYFFESYNQAAFMDHGINANFVQDNQSKSGRGTIRGLHFQTGDHAQAKLVRVLHGKVLDVAVDMRINSSTFGHHVAVLLSAENQKQLYIPRGFAHGFSTLSDEAIFAYKCDNFYASESEGGILYNDPTLNIDWQIREEEAILSEKDLSLKPFEYYRQNPCF